MTISEKRRQKKLAEKKKKRKLSTRSASSNASLHHAVASYAHYPIHECLIPNNLFETGMGSIIWARQTPMKEIAVSAFLVDTFCLGVKNALFHVTTLADYENNLKPHFVSLSNSNVLEGLHPACARKLVEGAVHYAKELGFTPHPDYRMAKGIFGDVDTSLCFTTFTYGKQGQPLYMRGPNESLVQAKRIVERLNRVCGPGNFNYIIAGQP